MALARPSQSSERATVYSACPCPLRLSGGGASPIALSTDVQRGSESMKRRPREVYNDVLERLVENVRELDPETSAEVEEARAAVKPGTDPHRSLRRVRDMPCHRLRGGDFRVVVPPTQRRWRALGLTVGHCSRFS